MASNHTVGYLLGEDEVHKINSRGVLSKKLNILMAKANKSRKEVSEDIGVSYFTFSDWCSGKKYPRIENLETMAEYIGVSVACLLGEEETVTDISYLQALNKLNELVQDKEFVELYETYKKLDDKNKKIVRGLIEDLKA